jgi:hypothetical protein
MKNFSQRVYDVASPEHNRMMCLNEMTRVNLNETVYLPANKYNVYVKGENAYRNFKHFHIKAADWDARFLLDGSFHSFKKKGKKMKTYQDIMEIENTAKQWVKKKNKKDPDKTNGKFAELLWDVQNE